MPFYVFLGCLAHAAFAQQGFYREYYAGITGSAVTNLTEAPVFPDSPTREEILSGVLETLSNTGDNYGQRLRARMTPPLTGSYTFWISSDENSELWLGTNAWPASRQRIAYVPSATGYRVWTTSVDQCSSAIGLTAGTQYYLEVLHKESTGSDNLAVAWLVPGSGVTSVIPASAMQPYLEVPAVKTQPASVDIDEQWAGLRYVTFSVDAVRKAGVAYQWQKDGEAISGATQTNYTCLADLANSNREFRCYLYSLGGAVTSQIARYQFVPDVVPPALVTNVFFHDRRSLMLTFSEPLRAASVSNGAFAVSGTTVVGATLLSGGTNVFLRLADSLAAGSSNSLSCSVDDCATPANTLTLTGAVISPPPFAATPLALIRGGVEPPGPSSRRSPLALTEISHTPAARGDGRDIRFVELYNANPFPQDIGGYRFSGAFDYTVPSGTVMSACGYLAVAPAPADIAAVFAITNVIGGFAAATFDGTSEITLNDELGAWLTTVAYSDEPPWPVAADGSGHTLVLARPSYGEREADGWAASARLGGSPGAAEPERPSAYAAVLFNEVLAHAGATPGFVELHNVSTVSVSLAGCVIKRGNPSLSGGYTLPEGTELPAGGFLAFDENTLGFLIDGTGDTLWLFAPAGAGGDVVDAFRFNNQEVGVSHGRYPDGDAAWNRLATPTPADENAPRRAAEVVLNELMYNPLSGDKDDEYIELYNPGTNAVNLAGWKLGGGVSYTFTESIASNGYLIVPHSRTKLAALYPDREAAMTVGGYDGSLNNSRDTVTLSKPVTVMDTAIPEAPVPVQKNAVVETVTYRDGGEWAELAAGGGSSLERIDPHADPRLARSWAASDETQKSAWTTVAFTGPIDNGFTLSAYGDPNAVDVGLMDGGECLVDAVEVQSAGGANLVNNPSFEAGTNFWRFMGTHEQSSVETNAAAPDGGAVLHVRASGRCHNVMNTVRGLMSATLAKSGTGTVSVRARWLSGSPELLVRTRGSWLEACGSILTTRALGSPGQRNSRAAEDAAPAVFDVLHQPVLPRNGEKITVYARAQDPDGVSGCTLYYRVEGVAGTNAVPMTPALGGYFVGEIPAGLPNNKIVAFTVEAADGHAQTARALFPAGAPARECLARFNEPLATRAFGIYRFWMTKEDVDYWKCRDQFSNKPVDATFLYGTNRVIYQAGMQYAGSPFHSYYSPIFPINNIDYEATFPGDDKLLDDDGVSLSTLGNLGSDTNGVREQFCYSLAQAVKIPHMYRRYIHLYANGAEQNPKKIYEDSERPGAGTLKHWFPEDSNNDFFKVDNWFEHALDFSAFNQIEARLQKHTTTNAENSVVLKLGRYRWNWLKRAYETFRANDYTNFFGLVETLNIADTNTYVQRIQEELNLEKFVAVLALNQYIGNFDSYGFEKGKNMYLYDSDAGWQLIAWDLDINFGLGGSLINPINPFLEGFVSDDPTMRTFLKTPLVTRIFWRSVAKLAAAAADPALQALARAKYDALKADGTTNITGTADGFLNVVDIRRTNVLAQIAAANPTNLTVAVPAAALSSSTQNVTAVSGTAPFSVTAFRVNGADAPVTWTTPSNWTVLVVLNEGTNTFQVQAYTEDGSLLPGGSVTRSIVYTGPPLDAMTEFLGFSEIMHTPSTNGAAYVEIANRSAATYMNLTGFNLSGAISFTFPNGTVMKPGDRLCVVANAAVFSAAYGSNLASCVAGTYSGTLPAAGTLLLKRPAVAFEPDDVVIDRVVYEAAYPWPAAIPAGTSLSLINPEIDNNRVANWSAGGEASATNACSPGADNPLEVTLSSLPAVWLNEVQPLNASGPADNLGEREPWVELFNAETSAVSLADWSLATASADPGWTFPSNAAVAAGGFLRVWLDGEPGETASGNLHAGFRFAVTNGLLVLRTPVDGRTVTVDYLRLANAAADAVWGAYPDGASNPRRWLNPATPAAPNRIDKPACRIVINEFMAQNDLFINPLNGMKDDWFELFNDGTGTVDLTGYVITDTLTGTDPPMPDLRSTKSLIVSNGVTLIPGQALRIWTGAAKPYLLPFDPANLQAPFGLAKGGDQIWLFNPALQPVDSIVYTNEQSGTASLGRWVNGAEGSFVALTQPTPSAPNRNPRFGSAVLVQPPAFTLREQELFGFTNTFVASRPDSFAFRLYPAEGAEIPTNLAFDVESGVLAWMPDESQGGRLFPLRVFGFVVDGVSVTAVDEILLTLSVNEVNSPPVYLSPTNFYLWRNEPFAVTLRCADPDLPPNRITYQLLSGPDGMTLDADTGLLQWQPALPQTGLFGLSFVISDQAGGECAPVVALHVDEASLQTSAFAPMVGCGAFEMRWDSKPDTFYTIEWCPDLSVGDWRAVNAEAPVAGTGGPLSVTLPPEDLGSPTNAFFRIRQTR